MFENLIGQGDTIRSLSHELREGIFPRAVVFSGPAASGKLTAALETARILTCEAGGDWSCDCAPCRQHRLLVHPYTVLTGHRVCHNELRAARNTLARTQTLAARYLFLRAVRKLTRRFDPHVFQADDGKRREIQDLLLAIEDDLTTLEPGRPLPEGKPAEKIFAHLEQHCDTLEGFLPRDNIPIAVVRSIGQWASFTSPSARKIVILESATRMAEGSRNALLKTLEEPPADTHFILLAERADELIPTIRSRLRVYRFLPRTPEETKEVLSRVFREDNPAYPTLKAYFLAWEDIRLDALRALARRFAEKALASERTYLPDDFPELFRKDAPRDLYRYFLEELVSAIGELAGSGAPEASTPAATAPPAALTRCEAWLRLIRTRARDFSALNLAPALFVESLFLALKEAS